MVVTAGTTDMASIMLELWLHEVVPFLDVSINTCNHNGKMKASETRRE
jgi:hypothetical protein